MANTYSPRIATRFLRTPASLFALVALAACLAITVGCGESGDIRQERDVGAPAGIALGGIDSGSSSSSRPSQPPPSLPEPQPVDEPEPEVPARPADIAQWKPEDYLNAKRAGDSQLAQAVGHLGESYPTSENAAKTLIAILDSSADAGQQDEENGSSDPSSQSQEAGQDGQFDAEVAQAIIVALCRNETAVGRQAVQDLLLAKLTTPLGRQQTVSTVISQLSANLAIESLRPAYEQILLVLVMQPEKILGLAAAEQSDPADDDAQGQRLTPDWLQQETLRQAGPASSAQFRTQLARYLTTQMEIPLETSQALEEFLIQDDPRNVAAQLVLFESPLTNAETKQNLQGFFATTSERAMAKLLDVSTDAYLSAPQASALPNLPPVGLLESAQSSGAAGEAAANQESDAQADPDTELFDVARRLWSPAMVGVLQKQLATDAAIDESNDQQPALALLGTTPLAEARRALMQYMEETPGAAEAVGSAGLTGSKVCDPAVLVMFKSGYHIVPGWSSRRRSTRGSTTSTEDGSQESPETAWKQAADGFVEQWYQRLQAAGAQQPAEDAPPLAQLPVRLPANLNVTAQYHLQLPADSPAELSGVAVAPLKLHYVRVEQEERPGRLISPIRRQVNRTIYENQGNTVTVDGLDRGSAPGTLLSVNVRLELTGGDSSQFNLSQPVVMELLIVEIPDPSPPEPES